MAAEDILARFLQRRGVPIQQQTDLDELRETSAITEPPLGLPQPISEIPLGTGY